MHCTFLAATNMLALIFRVLEQKRWCRGWMIGENETALILTSPPGARVHTVIPFCWWAVHPVISLSMGEKKVFKCKQTNQPINKHGEPWGAAEWLINRTTMREMAQTEKSTTDRISHIINRKYTGRAALNVWFGKYRTEPLQQESEDTRMSRIVASRGSLISHQHFHSGIPDLHFLAILLCTYSKLLKTSERHAQCFKCVIFKDRKCLGSFYLNLDLEVDHNTRNDRQSCRFSKET